MLERADLRVHYEVWHGDPSQTIVNAADRGLVDLIAMTTHGWRGLDRLRFGSIAESVVRKARVPVLLVRGLLRWPADRSPRILVPLDGSEQSAAILALVAKLRRRLHAAVELLHVLEALPPAAYPDLPLSLADASPGRAAARGYLDRVAARFAGESPKVDCVVLEGPAARVIARWIVDSRADLVAMTTQGRSGVVYQTMGFPVDMFPVLFAIPRTAGWLAQWLEMMADPEQKDRASPAALPQCHAT